MKMRLLIIAAIVLLPLTAFAQTSGGLTKSGTVTAGHIATWKNNSQLQDGGTAIISGGAAGGDLSGTYPNPTVAKIQGNAFDATNPINGQCAVYTGVFPTGTWGPGSCAAGGVGTVTLVNIIAGSGVTVSGTCNSTTIIGCTIALDPLASVTSFNGRFGVVVPATNDYSFSQLSGSLDCAQLPTFTTDVTNTACALTIANSAVTMAKLANGTALAVIGRSANSGGVYADIQASAASGAVLRESGSTIGFGTIATAGIANNAVTLAKLATQAANTVLANGTSGAAVPTAFGMPSCSGATSALQWLSNTGFQCGTMTNGTVTSVGGAGLATGTVTTTGNITVTAATASDQETATSTTTAVTPSVQQRHPSATKFSISCTLSGTTATLRDQYNLNGGSGGSCGRTNVGLFTVTFNQAFSSAFYTCTGGTNDRDRNVTVTTKTATTLSVATGTPGGALGDFNFDVICTGDQ